MPATIPSSAALALAAALACLAAPAAAQPAAPPGKGTALPRCLLYNSYRLTPQGTMQCSYQCGDRIILRAGYLTCPQSWARPPDGEP